MVKYYSHKAIKPNVGDTLSGVILEHFIKDKLQSCDKNEQGKLVSVGSVMRMVKPNDTVWGTGVIKSDDQFTDIDKARFLAVRGKLSRDVLISQGASVPEVYGDPALLLPLIYNPKVSKKYNVGYVYHYVDEKYQSEDNHNIPVSLDWKSFITEIKKCKKIVSSSLHGIIIAEAYGIPAEWVVYSNRITGGKFKFWDYLTGTGRNIQEPGLLPPINNLKEIQNKLIVALTKPKCCVITRMHYPKDHKDFKWRFEYYKNEVLPTLKNQTFKNFDIAVWCEKHHEKLFKKLGVIPFQATCPQYKGKLFKDFTSWDNVSGLEKYEIQVSLDSDDMLENNAIETIVSKSIGNKSLHFSLQPIKKDIKTGKVYKMRDYEKDGYGSGIYALYQPEFKYFVYHDSHLRIGKLFDKTIYLPEGYAYVSVHDKNDSTGIKDNDIEIVKSDKMDLCYLINSNGSSKVLKYSVRSAEKNLDYNNIYIVGKKPEYFNDNIIEIKIDDEQGINRFLNITKKLWAIINDNRISENFVVMNDDFFILDHFKKIPYYYIGTLKYYLNGRGSSFKGSHWNRIIKSQLKRFPDGKMFTPHFPIVYNKKKLAKLLLDKEVAESCVRSWYCNTYKVKGVKVTDKKVYDIPMMYKYMNSSFISSSDNVENSNIFIELLEYKFPNKSKYESVSEYEDKIVVVIGDVSELDLSCYGKVFVGCRDKNQVDDLINNGLIDGYFIVDDFFNSDSLIDKLEKEYNKKVILLNL